MRESRKFRMGISPMSPSEPGRAGRHQTRAISPHEIPAHDTICHIPGAPNLHSAPLHCARDYASAYPKAQEAFTDGMQRMGSQAG